MLHRHSGEGLRATGFEPERHSVMVLGRPVQASPPSAASEGCDGCFIFCVSCHPPHGRRPLRVGPPSCRLPSVFLCPTTVYHVTPAAARRAFRRVASRRELPLQVVCFLVFAAPVSGSLAFTRGRDRARSRAVLAACLEAVGAADAVWTLRCKGPGLPQARVLVLLLAGTGAATK